MPAFEAVSCERDSTRQNGLIARRKGSDSMKTALVTRGQTALKNIHATRGEGLYGFQVVVQLRGLVLESPWYVPLRLWLVSFLLFETCPCIEKKEHTMDCLSHVNMRDHLLTNDLCIIKELLGLVNSVTIIILQTGNILPIYL